MSMTGETLSADQQEFTIGRGGLKIPSLEWSGDPTDVQSDPSENLLYFFNKLWALNDFQKERVLVPSTDTKPMLAITYDRNVIREKWDSEQTYRVAVCQIEAAPTEIGGEFSTYFKIRSRFLRGLYGTTDSYIEFGDRVITKTGCFPENANNDFMAGRKSLTEIEQEANLTFDATLQQVLAETVQFLS